MRTPVRLTIATPLLTALGCNASEASAKGEEQSAVAPV